MYNENLEDDHSLKDYEVVLDRGDRDLQYLPFEHAQWNKMSSITIGEALRLLVMFQIKMRRNMEMLSDVEIEIEYTLDLAPINLFSIGGTLILNF